MEDGLELKKVMESCHIPVKLIKDAAVAFAMKYVDCVFVGCEGVVENGGVINKIGTYTIALCA
jgi:translation initiation factor eIF-2B subunit alpha